MINYLEYIKSMLLFRDLDLSIISPSEVKEKIGYI